MLSKRAQTWRLSSDICELAGVSSIGEALSRLNIIRESDDFVALVEHGEWYRGGAETYLFPFSVRTTYGRVDLVMKACIATGGLGFTVQQIMSEWLSRRSLLEEKGIGTPTLYGVSRACLIEEWVPFDFLTLLKSVEGRRQQLQLLGCLADYAAVIEDCGFSGRGPFDDLMSRGQDLVAVDFGEDLGPMGTEAKRFGSRCDEVIQHLSSHGVRLQQPQLNYLWEAFEVSKRRVHSQPPATKGAGSLERMPICRDSESPTLMQE
jgi:hypothetical protein